jgi:2-polyprenyl-3-methyl-5-hydroxy-6-metoxy-1,4-benzoquinol methylase
MINKKCYLCGKEDFKERSGCVRDNPALRVYECISCGLVSLSSFDHIVNQFYENSRIHDGEPLDIQEWLDITKVDDERRFQFLKSQLLNCSLLDFGCGVGGFLLKAKDASCKAHGIEPEKRLANHFQQNNITVFHSLEKVPQEHRQVGYDLITLFHVLEHLAEPKTVLHELSEMLTDNGQIIIEVPNSDDALLTIYNNEPFSHFIYWSCHLFYFSSNTLERLALQVGLKINYIRQIQRYPLSNHLYWLAKGKPSGHEYWHFLDDQILNVAYERQLAAIGKCDTIIGSFSKIA